MSTNLHAKLQGDSSYKLIQLAPDILQVLEDSEQELRFKSLDDDSANVVLCSQDRTWTVKQKNHSNTVMLMEEFVPETIATTDGGALFPGVPDPTQDFVGFATCSFEYETRLIEGQLDVGRVPIYDGDRLDKEDADGTLTVEELMSNSPCSKKEFVKKWQEIGGCVVDGHVCILSTAVLSKALHVILMSIMAESLDLAKLSVDETFAALSKDVEEEGYTIPYTKEIVQTVLAKFSKQAESTNKQYELDMDKIAKWYGIMALKKHVTHQSLDSDEFLIKWKSLFPPFFPCDIDLAMLRGWYYKPSMGRNDIRYISKNTLPNEPRERFKLLFKLQSQWDLEEIKPFIDELNVRGLKLQSFIMKYARIKRLKNGKAIVTSR